MATTRRQASPQGTLAVRLFGHTEMTLDGEPFKFSTPRKSLEALAYLLLNRGAPVKREYLAYVLFPDDEEGTARTRLRSTLSDMPKIVPSPLDHYVSIEGESVAWNQSAALWLDVDEFVDASGDPARLSEALDLYRGDLLPQIYDEWIDAARERHRNTYLRCLGTAVSLARRNADFGAAIEAARQILAVDPWREDIVRRIIAIRYESGDRAGALSEFRDFAKRLRAEMNAAPMPETLSLAERIQRGLDLPGPDDDAPRATSTAAPVLPFVGRGADLDTLLDAWNGVVRGRGSFAFVGGETGIGKTRLANEFAHVVEERGGRVLFGSTSYPEAVPYESVSDALRGALPLLSALKEDLTLASLAAIVPELRERAILPELPRLAPESERVRLFDALPRALGQLAQRPLLLVLEDLHWAGTATHDMLQFFVRRVAGKRIMVLVTYRDDETPRTHPLQRLRNEAQAALAAPNLWLGRLRASEVDEVCATLADSAGLADDLFQTTQGHPHFLTQLVLDMREGTREATPGSLGMLLHRRVERLSSEARTAAEIAASIGDHFSRDALREVSAWDDTALSNALDELLDRRIVREASGRGLFEYAFSHHAVHEAIAQAVPPQRDRVRRRRIARVLEELYPERAAELSALVARHYELGGDGENAARSYLEAARHSGSIGALEEARAHCDRGIELATDLRLRSQLLLERATVDSRRGDPASWNEALTELERTESALGDTNVHRSVCLQRFEFARNSEDREAQAKVVRELRRSIGNDEPYWEAQAYLAEMRLAWDEDRLGEAYDAGEKALLHSRVAGDDNSTARILCEMGIIEGSRGRLSSAQRLFEETSAATSRASDATIRFLQLRSEHLLAHQLRDNARAVSRAQQWLELATELGDRPQQALAHDMLAVALTSILKNFGQARRHFAAALEIFEESSAVPEYEYGGSLLNQAILETRAGYFDRGLALTEKALTLFTCSDQQRGRAVGLDNLVFLRAYAGQLDGARAAAHEALRLTRSLDLALNEASVLENLAFAEGRAENFDQALTLAQQSFEARSRSQSQVWSCKTLADTAIWHARLGSVAAACGAARQVLSDDDAIVNGSDFPTYCYWAAAQILHLYGNEAEAAGALQKGRRILQSTAENFDPEDRAQYLSIPWNAGLIRAIESGIWPSPPE